MVTLPQMVAQIPAGLPMIPSRAQLTGARLFQGTDGGQSVWLAQLNEFEPRSFYVSGDGHRFQQLSVPLRYLPETSDERSGLHPILTATPGFTPMALCWSGTDVQLLLNDSAKTGTLKEVPLTRKSSGDQLQNGAYFLFEDGPEPEPSGALLHWWERATNAQTPLPLGGIVDAIAHNLNNTNSIALSNLEFLQNALFDLCALIENPNSKTPEEKSRIVEDALVSLSDTSVAVERGSRFVRRLQDTFSGVSEASVDREMINSLFHEDKTDKTEAIPRVEAPVESRPVLPVSILLVEDEDDTRQVLAMGLRHIFQNVYEAASAEAALVVFAETPHISILMTDYRMEGGMNGVAFAREIRRQRPSLPILFLSGSIPEIKRELSPEEEATMSFLSKPTGALEVAEALTSLLKTNTPSPE